MGKHDPTRDGDVHSDTAKQLDPKEFEKSGQISTDDDNDETTERLVADLDALDALPVAWREACLAVPRHQFPPSQIWVEMTSTGTRSRSAVMRIRMAG